MDWKLNIPKVMHVYWDGGNLPYLRYMTVVSFMQHNPDWKVCLWMPAVKSVVRTWGSKELDYTPNWNDCLQDLLRLPIEVKTIDFTKFGLSNSISEVHKSDYLRYWILSTIGGVWSDMDIIYFRPITSLKVNTDENIDKNTFVCISPKYGHSIGFLMANNKTILFPMLLRDINIISEKYQCIGADLCNRYKTLEHINRFDSAQEIGMESVYYYDAKNIKDIYSRKTRSFPHNSIGIHWYAGHPLAGEYLRSTNGGINKNTNQLIGTL